MDTVDRFFARQREAWRALQRLGVSRARCETCNETNPVCFIGDVSEGRIEQGTLFAPCERCKRKHNAPKGNASIKKTWATLRKAGAMNTRCHCGEDNPFCMEADHVDGQQSSNTVIACCINCHLKRTRRQQTEYLQDGFDPTVPLIVMRNRMRGTAEHLELAVEHLREVEDFLHNWAVEELSPK